jgi:CRP/FNR family transcriptional regulator, cyclic AMP receptor protein
MFEGRSAVRLLDADPDLAAELDDRDVDEARVRLVARVDRVEPGSWDPQRALPDPDGHLGVLVLDGLMTRDVQIASTSCAELVGRGDLLRPWDDLRMHAPLQAGVDWHVLAPTDLALIDRRLVHALGAWPEIMSVMVLRSVARAQALAVSLAISCMSGLKLRLVVLMWHLADRWGRVGTEGVSIPLPLTHRTVGRLVGASRPSVSTALKELEREGVITPRGDGGWVLHSEPPPELESLHDRRAAQASAPA